MVKAIEESKVAVVNISTYEKVKERINPFSGSGNDPFFEKYFDEFYEPRYETQSVKTSLGSGVIIDKRGYVLTNWHVVQQASTIRINTLDEKEYEATLIGADPKSDVAVLKIKSNDNFPQIKMGESDDLLIGETVIAIGNPFGLSHTVTTGVVRALHRSIKRGDQTFEDFIQTDASINPGNSGGPLLNIKGELIGINTAIYSEAQGIGFAIPINTAKRIVHDLLMYGEVRSPWLGIYVRDLNKKLAEYFGYKGKHGVVISDVFSGSPADKSGLKKGDIITKIDRQIIKSKQSFDTVLNSYTADNSISINVFRNGTVHEISLTAKEFPVQLVDKLCWDILGIEVINNSSAAAQQLGLYSQKGVVIQKIRKNGQAFKRGLQAGDIVLQINEKEIKSIEDFKKNIARCAQKENILLLVQRGPYGYYLTFEMMQ
ncbi:MAG: Do family serine endopeptidase [Proteobacteria bacterium]|nr:Do family serine endopeptidase [Pseudomonadota bacterium]